MAKWIPAWRYVPIDFNQELGVLENITQKSVFRNNIGGTQLRVRFNNLYSDCPMVISHAAVAVHNRVTGRVPRSHYLPGQQPDLPGGQFPALFGSGQPDRDS